MLAGEKSMDFTNDYYVPEDFDAMYGTVNPSQGRVYLVPNPPFVVPENDDPLATLSSSSVPSNPEAPGILNPSPCVSCFDFHNRGDVATSPISEDPNPFTKSEWVGGAPTPMENLHSNISHVCNPYGNLDALNTGVPYDAADAEENCGSLSPYNTNSDALFDPHHSLGLALPAARPNSAPQSSEMNHNSCQDPSMPASPSPPRPSASPPTASPRTKRMPRRSRSIRQKRITSPPASISQVSPSTVSPSPPPRSRSRSQRSRDLKQAHNLIEKKYRTTLNEHFDALRSRLPKNLVASGSGFRGRGSKGDVLEWAGTYIRELEEEGEDLRKENRRLSCEVERLKAVLFEGMECSDRSAGKREGLAEEKGVER